MSEYRCVTTVNADADDVFGFVSDVDNMSQYLPTVQHAELQGRNRVLVKGESPNGPYEADGDIRIDEDSRRMEWNSDGEFKYRGWMQVTGDTRSCQVTVRLLFHPNATLAQQMGPDVDARINESLRNTLRTIKAVCEGSPVPGGGVAYPG